MIQLRKDGTYPTRCPACGAANALGTFHFLGAVTGVNGTCAACGATYFQTLPTGQFNRFPVSITTDYQHVRVDERGRWLVDLVKRCLAEDAGTSSDAWPKRRTASDRLRVTDSNPGTLAKITVVSCHPEPVEGLLARSHTREQTTNPILLFCLDPCYGHALLMLFNAQRHHEQPQRRTVPNRPIIAVVPRALVWLIPDYVAETWVIDTPLAGLEHNLPGFDAFVNQQLTRFDTVWLSHAHIHFDHRTMRFTDFTRTQKFDLNQFDQPGIQYLTFALREDRLWLRHGWERALFRSLNRLGFGPKTRPLWARWQARRYRKLAALIHQKLPATGITATGLTGGGQYPTDLGYAIDDQRLIGSLSPEQERSWCAQYARSHVVMGVHGSGMLLPTSLAAGFVDLLPPDKLAHYAEDVLLAHDNPIHQTLLGRFLPTSASPNQVADLVVTMLTEFPVWLAETRQRG